MKIKKEGGRERKKCTKGCKKGIWKREIRKLGGKKGGIEAGK